MSQKQIYRRKKIKSEKAKKIKMKNKTWKKWRKLGQKMQRNKFKIKKF